VGRGRADGRVAVLREREADGWRVGSWDATLEVAEDSLDGKVVGVIVAEEVLGIDSSRLSV